MNPAEALGLLLWALFVWAVIRATHLTRADEESAEVREHAEGGDHA